MSEGRERLEVAMREWCTRWPCGGPSSLFDDPPRYLGVPLDWFSDAQLLEHAEQLEGTIVARMHSDEEVAGWVARRDAFAARLALPWWRRIFG